MGFYLLLDFFGTVVEYSPSRTAQGYQRSYELTTGLGSALGSAESTQAWSTAFEGLEAASLASHEEFSMHQAARVALGTMLDRPAAEHEIEIAVDSYPNDWGQAIVYPPGMLEVLRDPSSAYLPASHRIASLAELGGLLRTRTLRHPSST